MGRVGQLPQQNDHSQKTPLNLKMKLLHYSSECIELQKHCDRNALTSKSVSGCIIQLFLVYFSEKHLKNFSLYPDSRLKQQTAGQEMTVFYGSPRRIIVM